MRHRAAPRMRGEFDRILIDLRGEEADFHCVQRVGERAHIVLNPELVEAILVDNARYFTKGGSTQYWRSLIGDGTATRPPLEPITANAEHHNDVRHWRRFLRKQILHHFGQSRFSGYRQNAVRETQELTDEWKALPARELTADARRLALANFSTCFSGDSYRAELEQACDAVLASRAAVKAAVDSQWLCPFDYDRSPSDRAWQAVQAKFVSGQRAVSARADCLSGTFDLIKARAYDDDDGESLFSSLTHAARVYDGGFPEGLIPGLLQVIFIAGTEPMASALTWLLWHLITDGELQDNVAGSLATSNSVLTSCIFESLRLHPPSWSIPRETVRTVGIRGQRVGPGAVFICSPLVQHYQARSYYDPDRFDPVRFAENRRSSGRFYPFGLGVRTCPAMSFAIMQLEAIAGTILRQWKLKPSDSLRGEFSPWLGAELGSAPGQTFAFQVEPR